MAYQEGERHLQDFLSFLGKSMSVKSQFLARTGSPPVLPRGPTWDAFHFAYRKPQSMA
jgi:hypothetical protein